MAEEEKGLGAEEASQGAGAFDVEDELLFDDAEEFDPLEVDDFDIDQEDMDDDNPQDTIDYPTIRNMPEPKPRERVFTPKRQGSAKEAILQLFSYNPARRPVMLEIINMCREGAPASQVVEMVDTYQKDNLSVYSPMSLVHALEGAGALTIADPEPAEEQETEEGDAEYLEVTETPDPVISATEEAIEVADEYAEGKEFRRIVMDHDAIYKEVYIAVMNLAKREEGSSFKEIDSLVLTYPICEKPRRFGGHFIDMLERTDAMIWKNRAWHLTEFGVRMLAELEEGGE